MLVHYASLPDTLAIHKSDKHNTDQFMCEWPGCRAVMADGQSLHEHHSRIHERKTYFCPIRMCHRRVETQDEWWEHVADERPDVEGIGPQILDQRYRIFDLTQMRAAREQARAVWEATCGSKDMEHTKIAILYAAYHSLTTREYFYKRGLSGQNFDADARNRQRVSQPESQPTSVKGQMRKKTTEAKAPPDPFANTEKLRGDTCFPKDSNTVTDTARHGDAKGKPDPVAVKAGDREPTMTTATKDSESVVQELDTDLEGSGNKDGTGEHLDGLR